MTAELRLPARAHAFLELCCNLKQHHFFLVCKNVTSCSDCPNIRYVAYNSRRASTSLSHHDQFLLQRAVVLLLKPLRTEHRIDRCSLVSLWTRCTTLCSFHSLQGNSSQSWVLYRLQTFHYSYKHHIQCFQRNLHIATS
jgi:hypothetical protein